MEAGSMGLPECDTPLVWIMIFTRSSGATAVLAHAPAVPPDSSSYGTRHRIRERGQVQQGGTGQSPSPAAGGGGGGGGGRDGGGGGGREDGGGGGGAGGGEEDGWWGGER